MNPRKEILDELQNISPLLAQIPEVSVLSVPENYFNQLSENIFTRIFQEEEANETTPAFTGIPSLNQQAPEGYFANLSNQILNKIKSNVVAKEDELAEFPLLLSIKKENIFSVPESYFENLSRVILEKTIETTPAKVIPIHTGKVVSMKRRWIKIAAAAVITGVIGVSSFFMINDADKNQPAYVLAAKEYPTAQKINAGINSLSDDAIIDYLESNGNILDNETLIKDVDTKGLPAMEDYLMDENTLNNYLNQIDADGVEKN